MSPRLPSVRVRDVVRILEREGWTLQRQKGSHAHYKKPGHRYLVTVPVHRGDISPGTLRSILEDAGLTEERFLELLRS